MLEAHTPVSHKGEPTMSDPWYLPEPPLIIVPPEDPSDYVKPSEETPAKRGPGRVKKPRAPQTLFS